MSSITDFVAILANSSLSEPRANRLKPGSRPNFFAEFCFPPEAGQVLLQLVAALAPGGNINGLTIGIKPNSAKQRPIPGVPGDWLFVRATTQYAPYVADMRGLQLLQGDPAACARIQALFYAGKRVRASLTPFAWTHDSGGRGISLNLAGIMEVADGERLNIGAGVAINALAQYAQAGTPSPLGQSPAPAVNPFAAAPVAPAPTPNPFAAAPNPFGQAAAAPAANPFGQPISAAPAASANPFTQQVAPAVNPFAR